MKLVKMHGIGNDYVYADCINEVLEDPAGLSVRIADRHFGVGSDGLILICPSDKADYEMRVYNADGSYAQMCGNGIRCVGKYLYDNGYLRKDTVDIESGGSVKHLQLLIENGVCIGARVDMGRPAIPGIAGKSDPHAILQAGGREHVLTLVSMGNPHAVEFVEDTEAVEIETIGPRIEHDPIFPDRTNVEFVQCLDAHTIRMRVWERGSAETYACGTGAVASAVASILNGYCEAGDITVHLKGGDLRITWDGKDGHAYMAGPASYVFEIKDLQL
ncbi:MAG: diaminopimelate epimerase [Clostridia bacterium]